MSIVTLAQFKSFARDELANVDDSFLQACIDAAEPLVKQYCQRDFTVASTASARSYTPAQPGNNVIRIHDCTTITSITDWGTTVDPTTYQTEPLNLLTMAGDPRPIEQVRRLYSPWGYDYGKPRVVVTATWGWAAIPGPVTQAVLLAARDIYINRNQPVELSHMVMTLLDPYKRAEAFGIG
jgi:hypothetical protein